MTSFQLKTIEDEEPQDETLMPELPMNRRPGISRLSSIEVPEEYYFPISTGNELFDSIFSRSVVRTHDSGSPESDADEASAAEDESTGLEYRRGIIPGSVTLFTGEPGTGKTTLMIFLASLLAERKHKGRPINPLFVTLEMDLVQLKFMADRFNPNDFEVTELANIDEIKDSIFATDHQVLIIDSLQLIRTDEGTEVSQRQQLEICRHLIDAAKESKVALFIVGHVNKNGKFAGSNSLKHMVDAHLHFYFDPDLGLRVLEMQKNRFGVTGVDSKLIVKIGAVDLALIHPKNVQELDNAVTKVKTAKEESFDYEHADVGKIILYSNCKMHIVAVGKTKYKACTLTGTKEYHPKKQSAIMTDEMFINGSVVPIAKKPLPKQSIVSASTGELGHPGVTAKVVDESHFTPSPATTDTNAPSDET